MVELLLSRSETLTWKLIRNPAIPTEKPSNRQSANTGLISKHTTPAPTLVGCGRACKLLQSTKGNTAESCPVTQAYQTSYITSMLTSRQVKASRLSLSESVTPTCFKQTTIGPKIESYYPGSEARRMWQGLQTITDYKGKHSRELPCDTSLPDELNNLCSLRGK